MILTHTHKSRNANGSTMVVPLVLLLLSVQFFVCKHRSLFLNSKTHFYIQHTSSSLYLLLLHIIDCVVHYRFLTEHNTFLNNANTTRRRRRSKDKEEDEEDIIIMSAWGGAAAAATKTPAAASWDDDDGENGLDFPGLGDPPPSAALKPTSTQPQQPKTTQTTGGGGGGGGKKKKGTKLSLAEFSGISSSVAAPMDHGGDGFYRGPGGGGGGGMDAYALPTAPNRDRREEEEHGGRRAGELGGAFREYGGDRGIGGGGRDRDEDRYDSRRGERYDRRGDRGDRYGDRENRYGDREGDRYDRRDNYRGRRDDDRDFDEDGRERRREPEPSRADTGDWSKRTALPERRKGEAALETVMAQIADTTIEAIANLVGRVARTLAIGLNERA